MRRPARYSRSPRGAPSTEALPEPPDTGDHPAAAGHAPTPRRRWQPDRGSLAFALVLALAAAAGMGALWSRSPTPGLTQKDIDAAVLHTLQRTALPSPAARAEPARCCSKSLSSRSAAAWPARV